MNDALNVRRLRAASQLPKTLANPNRLLPFWQLAMLRREARAA